MHLTGLIDSTRCCRQCVLELYRELFELRALLDLGDQPIGLAAAAGPRLRAIVGIDVLRDADLAFATSTKKLFQRKASLLGECRQVLLELAMFTLASRGNRPLKLALRSRVL